MASEALTHGDDMRLGADVWLGDDMGLGVDMGLGIADAAALERIALEDVRARAALRRLACIHREHHESAAVRYGDEYRRRERR